MIQHDFNEFHKQHPHIEKMFLSFALELRSEGVDKVRADEVLHRIRWELLTIMPAELSKTVTESIVILDDLKAIYGNRYAMKLMTEDKTWHGFFDLVIKYN